MVPTQVQQKHPVTTIGLRTKRTRSAAVGYIVWKKYFLYGPSSTVRLDTSSRRGFSTDLHRFDCPELLFILELADPHTSARAKRSGSMSIHALCACAAYSVYTPSVSPTCNESEDLCHNLRACPHPFWTVTSAA